MVGTGSLPGLRMGTAQAHSRGECCAEDEAARFHAGEGFGPGVAGHRGEMVDGGTKARTVRDQRGYVAEEDAGGREVRHGADEGFDLFGGHCAGDAIAGHEKGHRFRWPLFVSPKGKNDQCLSAQTFFLAR